MDWARSSSRSPRATPVSEATRSVRSTFGLRDCSFAGRGSRCLGPRADEFSTRERSTVPRRCTCLKPLRPTSSMTFTARCRRPTDAHRGS